MSKDKTDEASLEALRLPELQQKYAEVVGKPTRCPNKAWLMRKILDATQTHTLPASERQLETQTTATRRTMSVEELQVRHLELIGRPTSSRHVGYLRWRIRQAERGLVRIGSAARVPRGPDDILVLPLRMPAFVVEQMDEARRRLGLASRAELFRQALHRYFLDFEEREVAALLLRGEGGSDAGVAPVSDARS